MGGFNWEYMREKRILFRVTPVYPIILKKVLATILLPPSVFTISTYKAIIRNKTELRV